MTGCRSTRRTWKSWRSCALSWPILPSGPNPTPPSKTVWSRPSQPKRASDPGARWRRGPARRSRDQGLDAGRGRRGRRRHHRRRRHLLAAQHRLVGASSSRWASPPPTWRPAPRATPRSPRPCSGWRIELDATGLPRLDNGRFYQAWLRNAAGVLVPIGTFNEGQNVTLWAGRLAPRLPHADRHPGGRPTATRRRRGSGCSSAPSATDQRPVNWALPGPCSRKLFTPIWLSSVWNTSTNRSRSRARPSAQARVEAAGRRPAW